MDDDVPQVQQHPAGVRLPLAAQGRQPLPLQLLLQSGQQGLYLAPGLSGGDEEEVGEGSNIADVQ